ncbi:hypothetical protein EBESD8_56190 [Rhodococcus aetherivorans]|nr:hypothetical protein EBESD8_56190 [Rhodococcus aetherivorans]
MWTPPRGARRRFRDRSWGCPRGGAGGRRAPGTGPLLRHGFCGYPTVMEVLGILILVGVVVYVVVQRRRR